MQGYRRAFAFLSLVLLCAAAPAPAPTFDQRIHEVTDAKPPVRAITRRPGFHWFGYYDKLQFDPTGRYVLGMQTTFEHRSPTGDDVIKIGMVDLADNDRWIELGESRAWCWQQGCHLQWRPGSASEILWNDRDGDHFVCRVLDVKTGQKRTLPYPIDNLSPDGQWALGIDFGRVVDTRPGYGYAGVPDRNRDVLAPEDSGVYKMHLDTGQRTMLVTCAQVAKLPNPKVTPTDKHYINHIQWSPDGKRFLFLHRGGPGGLKFTRMYTAAADGTDLRPVDDGSSHYVWRDPQHISIWNNGYRLYKDDGSMKSRLLWQAPNGHQTYLTDINWLITDTYPQGKQQRDQVMYLYHLPTARMVLLGRFHLPLQYTGEWRCDLHPRLSPDGRKVCFDSPHGGNGRQMYLMDISNAIPAAK